MSGPHENEDEKALRKSPDVASDGLPWQDETLYRKLVENIPDAMLVVQDERVFFANAAAARLFRVHDARELSGIVASELVHPSCHALPEQRKRAAPLSQAGTPPVRALALRRDGSTVEVESASFAFAHQGRPAFLAIIRDSTARRAAEQEGERFQIALDSSADAIFLIDPEAMRFLDVNDTACQGLGYERRELLQLGPHDIKPLCDKLALQRQFSAVMAGEPGADIIKTVHQRKEGSSFPVEVRLRSFESGGRPLMVAVARDVTAREQTEAALRDSESRYQSLIGNLPGIAYRCALDADWTVNIFAGDVERMTGYPARDLPDRRRAYASIIHPDDGAMVERGVRERVAKRERYMLEYRIVHASGRWVTVQETGHGVFDDEGRMLWLDGFIWDVSARKTAELALRQSDARSRSILRVAPVGIGVVVNRVLREVNEAMVRMTGYSAGELLGKSVRMLYPTQADFDYVGTEKYRQIQEYGVGSVETRWRCKNGEVIDVLLSSSPIVPEDPSQGVTFTALDITAGKQAEKDRQAKEAAQRNALVQEVHHRIKNNLQGVIGLLRQHVSDHPETRPAIEAVIAQVNTVAVIHGLQSRTPQRELRLRELLREVVAATAKLAVVSPHPSIWDSLPCDVWLDSNAAVTIALVLNELVHNAFKHGMRNHGKGVQIELSGDDRLSIVHIRNSGSTLPQGFDLATGKGCGTGLDLVRTLLPSHGAQLSFHASGGLVHVELALSPPIIHTPSTVNTL